MTEESTMEIVILAVLVVIVAAYYGLFNAVEIAADMATNELKDKARDQKERLIDTNAKRNIDADTVAKAKENMMLMDSIEL